jgi:hypothetical protein
MSSISSSSSSDSVAGGIWHDESPECTPASSMCSITAPTNTSVPSHTASTSISIAPLEEPVDQHRVVGARLGRARDEALELVLRVDDLHRAAAEHLSSDATTTG